jgi:hypothetical protein
MPRSSSPPSSGWRARSRSEEPFGRPLSAVAARTPSSIERFAWWLTANGVALAVAASQSYLAFGAGIPRLIIDGLIVGLLQGLALWGLVRFRYWAALTVAALGLAVIAGIVTVLALGSLAGSVEKVDTELYIVLVYGVAAAAAGLVGGFVQSGALPSGRRIIPWLLGSACGAPFLFLALLYSVSASGTATGPLPTWALGLFGGLAYGVLSGIGLLRSVRPVTAIA